MDTLVPRLPSFIQRLREPKKLGSQGTRLGGGCLHRDGRLLGRIQVLSLSLALITDSNIKAYGHTAITQTSTHIKVLYMWRHGWLQSSVFMTSAHLGEYVLQELQLVGDGGRILLAQRTEERLQRDEVM